MKTLYELRQEYFDLVDVRKDELELPEERKTLKTETFVKMERELLRMCNEEKIRLGIIKESDRIGQGYRKRKRGSWEFKGGRKLSLIDL